MGKLKSFLICAAALCCPILICTGSTAGSALRSIAYVSAGVFPENSVYKNFFTNTESSEPFVSEPGGPKEQDFPNSYESISSDIAANKPVVQACVIDKNRKIYVDDTDYSKYTRRNARIYRYAYEKSVATNYIDLESGAQIRNLTETVNSLLEEEAKKMPNIKVRDPLEPTVLIYHTHTSESFMPEADVVDKNYPSRTQDYEKNMIAVGDALCESLAAHGVSVVHDCTVHDYPQYVGAYNLSAETILKNLEEYPSIRLVIDIHRDGIVNPDGSLVAPVTEINGRNAAQFMIISGCDCETYSIPHYLENFRLACMLQNISEKKYPNLARSILFDYRDYNQSLRPGILLIEVGSHGNSLNEAIYTGELLGEIIAEAVYKLK